MKGSVERSSLTVSEGFINEAIDDLLSSLGYACRHAVYDYLEKRSNLKRDDVASHIKEFSRALEEIFGDAAGLLEIQIMERLHRKAPRFKYLPTETVTLCDYVSALILFSERSKPKLASSAKLF